MTREKYESLPLSMLKALAKSRNMKGISTLRKEALIERMLEEDQKENQKNMEEPAVLKEEKKTETVQDQNQEPQEKREDGMERQNRENSENGTARPYQRPRYVRREERSENGERQEYRPRAPRFNERRFQEPRNYNQNNREEEQRQEPRQEAGQEMRQEPLRQEARPETRQEPRQETSTLDSGPGGLRHPRGHAGRIWIYPLRQLYAGRQRCLRFSVPNPPFRTENGRYHPRKHESKVRNRKIQRPFILKERQQSAARPDHAPRQFRRYDTGLPG